MNHSDINKLIDRHSIISDQIEINELQTILLELSSIARSSGSIVEFGCYLGTTSLYIKRMIGSSYDFHVYDSFEGLPSKLPQDISPLGEQFKQGELRVSKKQFVQQFQKAGLTPPVIHKGWFSELASTDIPNDIVYAFLDGDYYESIKTPLALITPKLAKGAIIIVDDYANQALPGAARATDEWCKSHGYAITTQHSLAIIHT